MSEESKSCDYTEMIKEVSMTESQLKRIKEGTNRESIKELLEMLIKNPSGVWIDEEKNEVWMVGIGEV